MEQTLKNQLFETFVKYDVTPYEYAQNGKLCDAKLVIIEPKLARIIEAQAKKVPVSKDDLIADVSVVIMEALDTFKPEGDDWNGIIHRTNTKAFNQLMKYLKTKIVNFCKVAYRNGYHTTTTLKDENGKTKRVNIYVSTNFSSLDKLLVNQESGDETPMVEMVKDSYWQAKEDSTAETFLEWYRNNRERILTKRQCELLDTLEKYNYSNENKQTVILQQEAGLNPKTTSQKLNNIKTRIAKAWAKERKFIEQTFPEKMLQRKIALLQIYLDIYEDKSNANVKTTQLSNFIRAHVDASVMEKLLDKLMLDEYKEVVRAVTDKTDVPCEILNKLMVYVEKEIEHLEMMLLNEQLMKAELADKQGVKVTKEAKKYFASTLYLHLDAYGALLEE